tara:strand:+ start:14997 stop:15272 length:276 start_codon:yes stop_codon:yes gene_type:complete
MFVNAFEIFLQSLAYSFWPFIFIIISLYMANKYFNHGYKQKIDKDKKISETGRKDEMQNLADKAINFKPPKIETSFGEQRIGEVYNHETKD